MHLIKDILYICLLLCFAEVQQLKGDLLLAMEFLKDCLTTIQKYCSINDSLLRKTYMMVGDTYMLHEDVDEALYEYEKGFSIEVNNEIEHYVYHVGYHLLMLNCTLESRGEILQTRNMHKNASISFQKHDYNGLFNFVEGLLDLRGNSINNDEICSSLYYLYTKVSIGAPTVTEILQNIDELQSYPSEQRYIVR